MTHQEHAKATADACAALNQAILAAQLDGIRTEVLTHQLVTMGAGSATLVSTTTYLEIKP